MADVDAPAENRYRGGGRGGGHGGGGGGNRKRRFREDDDQYDQRYQPRRRYEEPLSRIVRRQVLEVGEAPTRDPREEVATIAKTIVDNDRDEKFCSIITDLLPQVVVEQPLKIPFVAAILLYANEEKPSIVGDVLDKAGAALQTALDSGDWRSTKLLLRLLACVHSFFDGDGVFAILDELFNRAVDLQTASSEDALGPHLVKIIMLTIPFLLASPATGLEQRASELLEKTDIVASAPMATENAVEPYMTSGPDDFLRVQSPIKLLQQQLQAEAAKEWPLSIIPRLFKPGPKKEEQEADGSATNNKHRFPTVTVPQTVRQQGQNLFPEIWFSLYADQDVETVPRTTDIASSLLRDTLVDTINILDFNRIEAVRFLLETDSLWSPNSFAPRGIQFDRLKDFEPGKPTWKCEDLAIDAIFSQLLRLPEPEHKAICYHSMITQACKIAPGAVAPSLGRGIRFIYKHLDAFDTELSYRFTDWFAHHLSNFDFRWKWAEWIEDVEKPDLEPHKAFILGLLDKEIRLSFAKRIRDTLPEDYHKLVPATRENDIPEFKYKSETAAYSSEAKQIIEFLKKKAPMEDMQPVLDAVTQNEISLGKAAEGEAQLAAVDVLMTCISHIGSKSLSHLLQYIERYRSSLAYTAETVPGAKVVNVNAVVQHWRLVQPGVAVNTISKLLNYAVVSPDAVLQWLINPANLNGGRFLSETWAFEMVSMTLRKVSIRLHQILEARNQPGLSESTAASVEAALAQERQTIQSLFRLIEDALTAVADGAHDSILQDGADSEEELQTVKLWGAKWLRVMRRWLAVEELVVMDAVKSFPPPVSDDDMLVDADANGATTVTATANGVGDANGNANVDVDGANGVDMADNAVDEL